MPAKQTLTVYQPLQPEQGLVWFDIPEKVPFRLTQNVIDGFGITGVEGVFRRCCEISMRVLQENKNSLVSVLESFVHDPLVDLQLSRPGLHVGLSGLPCNLRYALNMPTTYRGLLLVVAQESGIWQKRDKGAARG